MRYSVFSASLVGALSVTRRAVFSLLLFQLLLTLHFHHPSFLSSSSLSSSSSSSSSSFFVWSLIVTVSPDFKSWPLAHGSQTYRHMPSLFGKTEDVNVTAPIYLVKDEQFCKPADDDGKKGYIFLVRRSPPDSQDSDPRHCHFTDKVYNAQVRGAAGVIVADEYRDSDHPNLPYGMASTKNLPINISSVLIFKDTLASILQTLDTASTFNVTEGSSVLTVSVTATLNDEGVMIVTPEDLYDSYAQYWAIIGLFYPPIYLLYSLSQFIKSRRQARQREAAGRPAAPAVAAAVAPPAPADQAPQPLDQQQQAAHLPQLPVAGQSVAAPQLQQQAHVGRGDDEYKQDDIELEAMTRNNRRVSSVASRVGLSRDADEQVRQALLSGSARMSDDIDNDGEHPSSSSSSASSLPKASSSITVPVSSSSPPVSSSTTSTSSTLLRSAVIESLVADQRRRQAAALRALSCSHWLGSPTTLLLFAVVFYLLQAFVAMLGFVLSMSYKDCLISVRWVLLMKAASCMLALRHAYWQTHTESDFQPYLDRAQHAVWWMMAFFNSLWLLFSAGTNTTADSITCQVKNPPGYNFSIFLLYLTGAWMTIYILVNYAIKYRAFGEGLGAIYGRVFHKYLQLGWVMATALDEPDPATALELNYLPIITYHRGLFDTHDNSDSDNTNDDNNNNNTNSNNNLTSSVSLPPSIVSTNVTDNNSITTISGSSSSSSSSSCDDDEDENAPACAVCFVAYADGDIIRPLPCNHHYHKECIDRWLQLRSFCPMCRMPVLRPTLPNTATAANNHHHNNNDFQQQLMEAEA